MSITIFLVIVIVFNLIEVYFNLYIFLHHSDIDISGQSIGILTLKSFKIKARILLD